MFRGLVLNLKERLNEMHIIYKRIKSDKTLNSSYTNRKKASWFKGGKLTRDRSGTFVDGRTTELWAYRSALKLPSLAI